MISAFEMQTSLAQGFA
ncbi:hypothetical protein QN277_007319 [Acacia crassicarpa]|uniref:Uncharacterized protein n=1 Tax=Acacia crassicarpa TaxID=499986 RepID=A0AAE1IVR3_9FABA|nr:hypothetical protein QN277_007319 [Acacia crassicarpa]